MPSSQNFVFADASNAWDMLATTRAAVVGSFALAAMLVMSDASAQQIQLTGPLADAPVLIRRWTREQRVEVGHGPELGLAGEQRWSVWQAGKVRWFPTESFALSAMGSVAMHDWLTTTGWLRDGSDEGERTRYRVGVELETTPILGKLLAFDSLYWRTTLQIKAGAWLVGIDHGIDSEQPGRVSAAPSVGAEVGNHIGDWFTVGFGYRVLPIELDDRLVVQHVGSLVLTAFVRDSSW